MAIHVFPIFLSKEVILMKRINWSHGILDRKTKLLDLEVTHALSLWRQALLKIKVFGSCFVPNVAWHLFMRITITHLRTCLSDTSNN